MNRSSHILSLISVLFWSLLAGAVHAQQLVELGAGYSCSDEGLLNKKGVVFSELTGSKKLQKQVRSTKSKRNKLRSSGASKKKISKFSKKLKVLQTVLKSIPDCFTGALFENSEGTPTPTPSGESKPSRDLLRVLLQIEGNYDNGTYSLSDGSTPLEGTIAASFELRGSEFSGTLVADPLLSLFLGAGPVPFGTDTAGKDFPLTFEVSNTPIGTLSITLTSDLSLSFSVDNIGLGDLGSLVWLGSFTPGTGFVGTLELRNTSGEIVLSGPLSLLR